MSPHRGRIHSPHPIALVVYLVSGVGLGIIASIDPVNVPLLTDSFSETVARLWGNVLIIGGTCAFVGALSVRRNPVPALIVESVGAGILGLCGGFYEIAIAQSRGMTVLVTQTLMITIALSGILRCILILFVDLRKVRNLQQGTPRAGD